MHYIDVYIGLGSNLDDPVKQLNKALAAISHLPETELTTMSSFYRTQPVGPQDQPDYINAVARARTRLPAVVMLGELQNIEQQQGRVRTTQWGPRTIDLDLLLYGGEIINSPGLQVPHPEMHRRGFVLYPLAEISPQINIPGRGMLKELLKNLDAHRICKLVVE